MQNDMTANPIQSVIIPTYNRKDMLAEAIDSVLKQSQKSLEVIVVDDCSTDGTEEYVKSIKDDRVHYFRNEKNSGQEYSRMIGLRCSRGEYITFIDDDDYYTDYDFFTKAIKIFCDNDTDELPLSIVCANAEALNMETGTRQLSVIGKPGRIRGIDFIIDPQYHKPLSTFPSVFKSESLKRAGLENMIIFDSETYWQAALEGDAWFMPDYIGVYREHKQSSTLGYTNHKALNNRLYGKVIAMAKRGVLIAEKLNTITDKKTSDTWCERAANILLHCYRGQQNYINELKTYGQAMLIMSKFTPAIGIKSIFWEIRRILSKITPLRKLYRFIKYRLRGKPYPED